MIVPEDKLLTGKVHYTEGQMDALFGNAKRAEVSHYDALMSVYGLCRDLLDRLEEMHDAQRRGDLKRLVDLAYGSEPPQMVLTRPMAAHVMDSLCVNGCNHDVRRALVTRDHVTLVRSQD